MGIHPVHVGSPFVGLYRGIDPDLAQVSDDRLGHFLVIQVPSVGGVEGEIKSFGIPGFGQKLSGLFRVVLIRFDRRIVSEMFIG